MIAKVPGLGTGFRGLQQYLLHGRQGAAPDRSVWVATRNLPEGDPERVADLMRHTAAASARTQKPAFHVAVSMAPGERLGREELEAVADRLLTDIGLGEHQALVAEHADGAQQHIHLMVNRVHPETGRAWSTSFEYRRIEQSLRAQEQELGLRVVPGRHAPVPGRKRVRGGRLSRRPFGQRVRELAGETLRDSKSWQELHAGLSRQGLTIRPSRSGRGLVLTDGRQFVAASRVDRNASRGRLEKRLGAYEAPSRDLERLQEVARDLAKRGRLEALRGRYKGALRELGKALADHEKAGLELGRAGKGLDSALAGVFRDPSSARRAVDRSLERRGVRSTIERLERRPGDFGKLRGGVARSARERAAARQGLRHEVPRALRRFGAARQAERSALERLEPYRAKPHRPLLEAAGRARAILGRALDRLERIDRRTQPIERLEATAAALVKRLGWQAVGRLVPQPAFQMIRVAVSLAQTPSRVMDRGLDR